MIQNIEAGNLSSIDQMRIDNGWLTRSKNKSSDIYIHMARIGIYKIENLINGRIYIGSAINVKTRWNCHLYRLRKGTHHNQYLLADYRKCGEEAFSFSIIVECSKDILLMEEQKLIDKHYDDQKMCYNLRKVAKNNTGYKASEETKKKQSNALKGKAPSPQTVEASKKFHTGRSWEEKYGKEQADKMKEKMSQDSKQKMVELGFEKLSDRSKKLWQNKEHREKMIKIHKERFKSGAVHPMLGRKHSHESLLQMALIHSKGQVQQINGDGLIVAIFDNCEDAGRKTGVHADNIARVCRGLRKTAGGFMWRRI